MSSGVPSPGDEGNEYAHALLAAGERMPAGLLAMPGASVGPKLGYTPAQWREFRCAVVNVFMKEYAICRKKSG